MVRKPTRVSQYFKLNRDQPSLDFVDVDVRGDSRIFVDPRALRLLHSSWADECAALVQSFFHAVLREIRRGANAKARRLLSALKEPNETHLGLSRDKAQGRALGQQSARNVWKALSESEAVKSGLLEDLEDTILMVEGISSDIISDITTNLIRGPLIRYTQQMAKHYGIPLKPKVNSGPLWDPKNKRWYSELVAMPVTKYGRLLLVPKAIVRLKLDYDVNEYYRHYLLEHLREVELKANTELVHLIKKTKKPHVTKKDLIAKYGSGKEMIVRETQNHPSVLESYRKRKSKNSQPPLDHLDLSGSEGTPPPDWDSLLKKVLSVPPGKKDASRYENAIEGLLSALFYPALSYPQVQHKIHNGRKRIDITYTNMATKGFFFWLGQHYAAPHIFVECKNYSADPGNPELDQLSSRFSPSRGQVGIMVCRNFTDKNLFIKRCEDTAKDQRGFVIALDDTDLKLLVEQRKRISATMELPLLKQRIDHLIM
jgi:hypothetical protein